MAPLRIIIYSASADASVDVSADMSEDSFDQCFVLSYHMFKNDLGDGTFS